MPISVSLRRWAYRAAYILLRVDWFLRRPETAGVKCLITDAERVLLVRHTYGPRRWDIPGGRLRRHEDPADAAEREMAEELGLHGPGWRALGTVLEQGGGRRNLLRCFTCELHDPALEVARSELAVAQWFPRDGLPTPRAPQVDAIVALAYA